MPFNNLADGGSLESHPNAHDAAKEAESKKAAREDREAKEENEEGKREGRQCGDLPYSQLGQVSARKVRMEAAAVRWTVAQRIVIASVLTLPAVALSGLMAFKMVGTSRSLAWKK